MSPHLLSLFSFSLVLSGSLFLSTYTLFCPLILSPWPRWLRTPNFNFSVKRFLLCPVICPVRGRRTTRTLCSCSITGSAPGILPTCVVCGGRPAGLPTYLVERDAPLLNFQTRWVWANQLSPPSSPPSSNPKLAFLNYLSGEIGPHECRPCALSSGGRLI